MLIICHAAKNTSRAAPVTFALKFFDTIKQV